MHVGSGDAKKVWHLPEKLLMSNSTFFTAALQGGFAEGLSKNVKLPQEDAEIFKYFVEWLYVGYDQAAAFEPEFLVHLWTLGDRLGCSLMQNDAMRKLIAYEYDDHIEEVTLNQIYELSAPKSKIRRLAIDKCLYHIRQDCPGRHENRCTFLRFVKDNEDFAQQLAEATILLGSGDPNVPYRDKSPYLWAPSPAKSKTRSGS